ncbi:MAG TPA: DUF3857 domain-containing protein [Acidobacteriota bacterium]|nr:DUF3857 domain-containing protein [Acidobacteriota bacterium]
MMKTARGRRIAWTGLAALALLFAQGPRTELLAADQAPSWLSAAADKSIPEDWKDEPAVVLLDEKHVAVNEKGETTVRRRLALAVRSRSGERYATEKVVYLTDGDKVRSINAWLIRPDGDVRRFKEKEAYDVSLADNDIYNEARAKVVRAVEEAKPGSVFGCEWVLERKTIFTQIAEGLQERGLPTLDFQMRLTLPQGWRVEPTFFNMDDPPQAEVAGNSHSWRAGPLQGIPSEPSSPSASALMPRLALSYFPDGAAPFSGPSFVSWKEVSAWLTQLNDQQVDSGGEIARTAQQLTAGAEDEWSRLQALAGHAQSVNYVSIQTGIGRGGGYRPRAAHEVLSKNYGDCKDKANLLRSLLKAQDIESYAVAIYVGDPDFVREEWPSPQQFNHAISAIRVSQQVQAPAVAEHSQLGRLLFFDPTDTVTPVGLLPEVLQGALGLVLAGEDGVLMPLPASPAEDNILRRSVQARLHADGSISANLIEESTGNVGVAEQKLFSRLSRPDYRAAIQEWIVEDATGAQLQELRTDPLGGGKEGQFTLEVEFNAPAYAQVMQSRIMLFQPILVGRRDRNRFASALRQLPVQLEAQQFEEETVFTLPAGFEADELPEPLQLSESFGDYQSSCQTQAGEVRCRRNLTLKRTLVPPHDYPLLRDFFERIRSAEQAPAVLIKP